MDIKILQKILADQSISFESFSQLNFGINSIAWKVKSKEKFYFLKCYKSNRYDKRDRIGAESNFLQLMQLGKIKNVPQIIKEDKKHNWILLNWIEGEKVVNPSQKDWVLMVEFINRLQDLRNLEFSKKILNASEACFEIMDHFNLIKKRLNILIKQIKNQEINNSIIYWLENEVNSSLENCPFNINKFLKQKEICEKRIQRVLSPSDIGFHNVIKKDNYLFFHDFEYAGWDDPYKLLVDLLIQPENITGQEVSNYLIKSFIDNFKIPDNIGYLKIFITLYRVKWICIILKKLNHNNENNDFLLKKSIDYFTKVGSLWHL